MKALKKLGPRPLRLDELVALLDASDFHHLRDEDRVLPRRLVDRRNEADGIMDAIEARCRDEKGDDRFARLLMRRPEDPDPVQPLEDLDMRALVERLELAWQHRVSDTLAYGLRVGLVLGAVAQSTLDEAEEFARPLHLTPVLGAMLDVAEALDGEAAMWEAAWEERQREWRASGKTFAEFALPDLLGPDDDDEAAGA